jgi:hypothetical protein
MLRHVSGKQLVRHVPQQADAQQRQYRTTESR